MAETFPTTEDVVFYSLTQKLDEQYTDITRFRNAVLLASISIFFIALMGLLGYVGDEIRFAGKIAIRKVNGAGYLWHIEIVFRKRIVDSPSGGAYRCRTGLLDRYEMVGTI